MSEPYAWDCPCGTRNAPVFRQCRRCRAPESAGRPLYDTPPPAPPPPPRQSSGMPAWQFTIWWLLALPFLAVGGWVVLVPVLLIWLIWRLAVGVWTIARKL